MKKPTVSQEGLKLIASLTMLIDHIGAVLVYAIYHSAWNAGNYTLSNAMAALYEPMRIIGRIAFPIYCFLLVEGFHHTRNVKKYITRLSVGMLLSEIPFDLAFSGRMDWESSSVMVTLLLGCLMMQCIQRLGGIWKLAVILPFVQIAEWLGTDYGGNGIALIAMLALTKGLPKEKLWRSAGFVILLWFGPDVQVGSLNIPMELFALIGLVPMFLYEGKKLTQSKWVQWAFYLFYPVHLLILWILERMFIS